MLEVQQLNHHVVQVEPSDHHEWQDVICNCLTLNLEYLLLEESSEIHQGNLPPETINYRLVKERC